MTWDDTRTRLGATQFSRLDLDRLVAGSVLKVAGAPNLIKEFNGNLIMVRILQFRPNRGVEGANETHYLREGHSAPLQVVDAPWFEIVLREPRCPPEP